MMKLLNKAAVTCRPCPTNAELAVALGLKNAEVARYEFNRLVRQGKIAVAGFGPRRRRVVTIVATGQQTRSEEHTSELQSLMRISYAVFCLKKKKEYRQRRH